MRISRMLSVAVAAAAVVSLGAASRGPGPGAVRSEVSVVTV
jgi:hypothetical protein